ncbi:MAG: esterase [Chitinophagaceae bacterium]|jgi:enterochelin esterase-like enzyme|nr:esterase [Chitinophagaceae bacterium]HNJ55051.1 alpha/beta hydrolase-fold protein [Chitinophagaceae bacterium]
MYSLKEVSVLVEQNLIKSTFLKRTVVVDFYFPANVNTANSASVLLINDGQDMVRMEFAEILEKMYGVDMISPLICICIHCGTERKREYGVAGIPDYKGRGDKAQLYTRFILEELLPVVKSRFPETESKPKAFAGFSLGALSALDIVWHHPDIFNKAGVFSGSLWWRSMDQELPEYDDQEHRIIHKVIREDVAKPGLKFFFQCGNMDETKDRNNNGIIDSIDDTLDLMYELKEKGYEPGRDIEYLELSDGRHDVPTWGKAMPVFLNWGWGRRKVESNK